MQYLIYIGPKNALTMTLLLYYRSIFCPHMSHVTLSDLLIQLLHLAHQTSEIVMPTRVSTSAVSSFSPSICPCDQTILMHMYCCEHKILVMDLLNTTYFKLHTPDACLKDLGNFCR